MKNFSKLLLSIAFLCNNYINAQTQPSNYQTLPFQLNSFSGSTVPNYMAIHRFGTSSGSIPKSRIVTNGNGDLPYNSATSTGGWRSEGNNGLSMLASGSNAAGAIIVALDTRNKQNIIVNWKGVVIANQSSRDCGLSLQYRVGTSGNFANVSNKIFNAQGKSNNTVESFVDTLPVACNNKAQVQVRWIYWETNPSSGSRDRLALDDVNITGSDLGKLTIDSSKFNNGLLARTRVGSISDSIQVGFKAENVEDTLKIKAPFGFEIRLPNGTWSTEIKVSVNGTYEDSFYVRFKPTSVGQFLGDITFNNKNLTEFKLRINGTGFGEDLTATSFNNISLTYCEGSEEFFGRIRNTGSDTITSFQYGLYLGNNRINLDTIRNIMLAPNTDTFISLGVLNLVGNTTPNVAFVVYSPNDTNDVTPTNDSTFSAIGVYALPIVDAGNDASICKNDPQQVGPNSPNTDLAYEWTSKPAGFTSKNFSPIVRPEVTTVYYLTVTSSTTGCSNTDSVTISVLPSPEISAKPENGITEVCFGTEVVLGVDSLNSLHTSNNWFNLSGSLLHTGATYTVKPSVTSTYILVTTGANNCTSTDSVTITVNPLPATPIGDEYEICPGTMVTIGGDSVANNSYAWFIGDSLISNQLKTNVAPNTNTTYKLIATSELGCVDSDFVDVFMPNAPDLSIIRANDSVCRGLSLMLSINYNNNFSYEWYDLKGTIVTDSIVTVTPDSSQWFYIKATTTGILSCEFIDSVFITVLDVPAASIEGPENNSFCDGSTTVLKAITNNPSHIIRWYENDVLLENETDTVLTIGKSSTYKIEVENENGCFTTSSNLQVFTNPKPAVPVITREETILTSSEATTYQWLKNGTEVAGAESQTFEATEGENATYQVRVTNEFGCEEISDTVNYQGLSLNYTPSKNLLVYPNPTTGIPITIILDNMADPINQLLVMDMKGAVLNINYSIQSQNIVIETVGLSKGIYNVRISTDNNIYIAKFIVN